MAGNYFDRGRQGCWPAAGPRATVLVGPGYAHYTGCGLAGITSDSARARRSTPFRDHGTPAQAGQTSQPVDTGNHSGLGAGQTTRATETVRWLAGDFACGH